MFQKLKKALYTADNPDVFVIVRAADEGSIQAWSIARFRAACVIARIKHQLGNVELLVPKHALLRAKSLGDVAREALVISRGNWRMETLRLLDEADKVTESIVHVSNLKQLEKLNVNALSVSDLYCEIVISKKTVKCKGEFGAITMPVKFASPGSIGISLRYLAEAVKNLIATETVSLGIARYKETHVLVLASEHERHYIAEMRKKR